MVLPTWRRSVRAAVQPAAAPPFRPMPAHNGAQAAVVAHAHHCSLRRLVDLLPSRDRRFHPGATRAVLIVLRRPASATPSPLAGKKPYPRSSALLHDRLQVRVHRGVNAQAAVVQQIGRRGSVQAILLRSERVATHPSMHLIGEIARGLAFPPPPHCPARWPMGWAEAALYCSSVI